MSNRRVAKLAKQRFKCPKCNHKHATKVPQANNTVIYICQKCKKPWRIRVQAEEIARSRSSRTELRIPDGV